MDLDIRKQQIKRLLEDDEFSVRKQHYDMTEDKYGWKFKLKNSETRNG